MYVSAPGVRRLGRVHTQQARFVGTTPKRLAVCSALAADKLKGGFGGRENKQRLVHVVAEWRTSCSCGQFEQVVLCAAGSRFAFGAMCGAEPSRAGKWRGAAAGTALGEAGGGASCDAVLVTVPAVARVVQPWTRHRRMAWCLVETREHAVVLYAARQLVRCGAGAFDEVDIQYQPLCTLLRVARAIPARRVLALDPRRTRFVERGESIVVLKVRGKLGTRISFRSRHERRAWLEGVRARFFTRRRAVCVLDSLRSFQSPKLDTIGSDYKYDEWRWARL